MNFSKCPNFLSENKTEPTKLSQFFLLAGHKPPCTCFGVIASEGYSVHVNDSLVQLWSPGITLTAIQVRFGSLFLFVIQNDFQFHRSSTISNYMEAEHPSKQLCPNGQGCSHGILPSATAKVHAQQGND